MRLNINQKESANVQSAQVINKVEDAVAEEIVDIPEVSDVTPVKAAKATEKPKAKTEKPQAQTPVPQGKLTYQTYEKTKTNKKTGKPYTVTHAKIMGFAETDEAYRRGVELHGAVSGEILSGVKVFGLYFSHRYAAAAKLVCDALNAGKSFAECVAIIDNATEENAKRREEWKQKIEERKSRKAERESAEKPQTSKGYSDKDVAEMLKKILAGGAIPADIKKLLTKAA